MRAIINWLCEPVDISTGLMWGFCITMCSCALAGLGFMAWKLLIVLNSNT